MIKNFFNFINESKKLKCSICKSSMYQTDKGGGVKTYHCSSDDARFWDYPRGSSDQSVSKKHWDDSRINIKQS